MFCLHFLRHQAVGIDCCLCISKSSGLVMENVGPKCKDGWQPMEKLGDIRNNSVHA